MSRNPEGRGSNPRLGSRRSYDVAHQLNTLNYCVLAVIPVEFWTNLKIISCWLSESNISNSSINWNQYQTAQSTEPKTHQSIPLSPPLFPRLRPRRRFPAWYATPIPTSSTPLIGFYPQFLFLRFWLNPPFPFPSLSHPIPSADSKQTSLWYPLIMCHIDIQM